jgi:hypothetical protein
MLGLITRVHGGVEVARSDRDQCREGVYQAVVDGA